MKLHDVIDWAHQLPEWATRNFVAVVGTAWYAITQTSFVGWVTILWVSVQCTRFLVKWLRLERARARWIRDHPGVTIPADLQ